MSPAGSPHSSPDASDPDGDPGWPWISPLVFPSSVAFYLQRHQGEDLRRVLRMVTVGFVELLLGMTLVAVLLFEGGTHGWVGVLVGLAIVAALVQRAVERPLDGASDAALADSYRTRFFIRAAGSNLVGLVGFIGLAAGGPRWTYGVAVVAALGLLAAGAPTRANIARDQAVLDRTGSGRLLTRALQGTLARPTEE